MPSSFRAAIVLASLTLLGAPAARADGTRPAPAVDNGPPTVVYAATAALPVPQPWSGLWTLGTAVTLVAAVAAGRRPRRGRGARGHGSASSVDR